MRLGVVAVLLVEAGHALALSYTTSFKTVGFQPILLDVTVADWDQIEHENALYLTCPHEDLVVDAGPVIYDASGHPVWMNSGSPFEGNQCHDVNVQTYNGTSYLTVWVGQGTASGYGQGNGLMFDSSYNLAKTVSAGNGLSAGESRYYVPNTPCQPPLRSS